MIKNWFIARWRKPVHCSCISEDSDEEKASEETKDEDAIDVLSYTKQGNFTSEIYKIEINNLPRFGFKVCSFEAHTCINIVHTYISLKVIDLHGCISENYWYIHNTCNTCYPYLPSRLYKIKAIWFSTMLHLDSIYDTILHLHLVLF